MSEGYTVRQASERLRISEATVRRAIGVGLIAVPGPGPTRLTAVSVEAERIARIRALGGYPEPVCTPEHEALEGDNERLRYTIQRLQSVIDELQEVVREFTLPRVPND